MNIVCNLKQSYDKTFLAYWNRCKYVPLTSQCKAMKIKVYSNKYWMATDGVWTHVLLVDLVITSLIYLLLVQCRSTLMSLYMVHVSLHKSMKCLFFYMLYLYIVISLQSYVMNEISLLKFKLFLLLMLTTMYW